MKLVSYPTASAHRRSALAFSTLNCPAAKAHPSFLRSCGPSNRLEEVLDGADDTWVIADRGGRAGQPTRSGGRQGIRHGRVPGGEGIEWGRGRVKDGTKVVNLEHDQRREIQGKVRFC